MKDRSLHLNIMTIPPSQTTQIWHAVPKRYPTIPLGLRGGFFAFQAIIPARIHAFGY
jgi:hypothetical protein